MSDAKFVTVAEAAAQAGIPPIPRTTIYRWIASKAVRSQRNGQMMLVSLDDVRRVAAARRAGGFPEIPGNLIDKTLDNGKVEQQPLEPAAIKGAPATKALDGETQAVVLRKFVEGQDPVSIAIEMKLLLPQVMALHAEWKRACEESGASANPLAELAERVVRLEARINKMEEEKIDPACGAVDTLELRQSALAKNVERLDSVPQPLPLQKNDYK